MSETWSFIKISGVDASKFLQGQITIDINDVQPHSFLLAAHCNPQGRVISLFHITRFESDYYLILPTDLSDIAFNAFKKYAVFFKLTMTKENCLPFSLPTNIGDIKNGIPQIHAVTSAMFLPHELNLPELNAVNFNKGCYTGQEIIARMHYRGKLKKHLYCATINTHTQPQPGQDVFLKNNNQTELAGNIVNCEKTAENSYFLTLVCDEANTQNNFLFLTEGENAYVTFIKR